MEIHFYEEASFCPADKNLLIDWQGSYTAIENRREEIHTTQMCLLSSTLFHKGYRVFVHQNNGVAYELTLRTKENNGDKTVRHSQSMYAMWASNVFRE